MGVLVIVGVLVGASSISRGVIVADGVTMNAYTAWVGRTVIARVGVAVGAVVSVRCTGIAQ